MKLPAISTLLHDHERGQSAFVLTHFVVAAEGGPTTWGMYQQALRELASHAGTLERDLIARERLRLELRVATAGHRRTPVERAQAALSARTARLGLNELAPALKDRRRLIAFFRGRAAALRDELLKGGPLTPRRRAELSAEAVVLRLRYRVAAELATAGTINPGTLAHLAALPRATRALLAEEVRTQREQLVAWWQDLPAEPVRLLGARSC